MADKSINKGENLANFDSATGHFRSRSVEDLQFHDSQEKRIEREAKHLLAKLARRDPEHLLAKMRTRQRDVNHYYGRGLTVLPEPHYYYHNNKKYVGFAVR